MGETRTADVERAPPGRATVGGLVAVLLSEALLVGAYVARPDVHLTNPLVFLYPFVWIDVGVLAVVTTRPPRATRRRRVVAVAVATGYLAVLAWFGGLVGPGSGGIAPHVAWGLPPGYGPVFLYGGSLLRVVFEPYKLVGYGALTYLVYVTLLDAAGSAASGVVGLFSCVSCTWPILGTVATSLFGGTSAVAAVALGQAYGLSTLVFLSAVLLLWWRPTL